MRFDDRLMTVLDQPAIDPHDRAVRWRQLVDLVARAGSQADNPLVEQALHLIRSDGELVDEKLRAAAARAVAALPLPYELVALFAADTMAVAAPVLAAARLKREEWQKLLDVAGEE
ncbi:MAG TPA: sensor histidine kinase, partial [Sphingomicrobium sp.]|nr:sensor histidine kinase [Sphingomicrobium sp.]